MSAQTMDTRMFLSACTVSGWPVRTWRDTAYGVLWELAEIKIRDRWTPLGEPRRYLDGGWDAAAIFEGVEWAVARWHATDEDVEWAEILRQGLPDNLLPATIFRDFDEVTGKARYFPSTKSREALAGLPIVTLLPTRAAQERAGR